MMKLQIDMTSRERNGSRYVMWYAFSDSEAKHLNFWNEKQDKESVMLLTRNVGCSEDESMLRLLRLL